MAESTTTTSLQLTATNPDWVHCCLCDLHVPDEQLWVSVLVSKDAEDQERNKRQVLLSHYLCYTQFMEDNGCRKFSGSVCHLARVSNKTERKRLLAQAIYLFDNARQEAVTRMLRNTHLEPEGSPPRSTQSQEVLATESKVVLSQEKGLGKRSRSDELINTSKRAKIARMVGVPARVTASYIQRWQQKRKGGIESNKAKNKRINEVVNEGAPLTRSRTGRRQKTVFLHTIRKFPISTFSSHDGSVIEVFSTSDVGNVDGLGNVLTTINPNGTSSTKVGPLSEERKHKFKLML